jgi:signal transduction histidine kinase
MLPQDCATLNGYIHTLITARWLLSATASLMVTVGMLLFPGAANWSALLVITAVLAGFNLYWQRQTAVKSPSACRGAIDLSSHQIMVDFVLLAFAVHLTGGVTGPLTPMFVLHGIFSAVLMPVRYTIRTISLAVALMLISLGADQIPATTAHWAFASDTFRPSWLDDAMKLACLIASTVGATAISFDISRKLRRMHSQIQLLVSELEIKNRNLRHVDEQRVWLLGTASHDLKSPLGAVEMKLDMMLDGYMGAITEDQRTEIRKMHQRLESLRLLITDILDLTALDMKDTSAEAARNTDVAAQLRETVAEQDAPAKAVGLTVNLNLPSGPAEVVAAPRRLERVWQNLVSNAIKYGAGGRSIDIACTVDGGKVAVTIADHGIGISSEDQKRLFSDFFRTADAKKRGIPGSGLGLSITKRIIEEFGGTISIESRQGGGSKFTVTLPAAKTTSA